MAILHCTWPLQPAICEPRLLPVEHVSYSCMVLAAKFGIIARVLACPSCYHLLCAQSWGLVVIAHMSRGMTWSIQCDCSGPVWSCS